MASAWYNCPKCGSDHAWKEDRGDDTWLRCLCGLCKLVSTRLQSVVLKSIKSKRALPRQDTMMWDCLMMLSGLEVADTQEITYRLNIVRETPLTTREVGTQLSVLWRAKGLVYPQEIRERLPGGSIWALTDEARQLIKEKGN